MSWYDPRTWVDESKSTVDKRANLNETGQAANQFGEWAQGGVQALGNEAAASRDYLRDQAQGENSVSAEQLRQGIQQGLAANQSMAASANPQNAAMAARTAAIQGGRMASGLAGQQAVAGLAERNQAQSQLAQMLMQQRQQDLQAALQSRQTAVGAYGGVTPEGTQIDKWTPAINAGVGAAGMIAKSDRRAKTEITDGDSDANKMIAGLKAYTYKYKDEKADGEGARTGIMAQDLEKAGIKHAVMDTPNGKVVHGAHLATANTAMIAALGRRLAKVEEGK